MDDQEERVLVDPVISIDQDTDNEKEQTVRRDEQRAVEDITEQLPLPEHGPEADLEVNQNDRFRWSHFLRSGLAIIVLVWNIVISVLFNSYPYVPAFNNYFIVYGIYTIPLLFYPLAVCLADTRWGRRKTVMNSLCFMFWSVLLIVVFNCLVTVGFIPLLIHPEHVWNLHNIR